MLFQSDCWAKTLGSDVTCVQLEIVRVSMLPWYKREKEEKEKMSNHV